MEGNDAPGKVNLRQVVEIVSSYVRHNTIAADDLPRVIADVYRALAGGEQPTPVQEPQGPAVPIRRSVGPEEVVCLECGHRARTLRRHLREAHGLSPNEYRARWGACCGSSVGRARLLGAALGDCQSQRFRPAAHIARPWPGLGLVLQLHSN